MSVLQSSRDGCSVPFVGSHVPNGVEKGKVKSAGRSAN